MKVFWSFRQSTSDAKKKTLFAAARCIRIAHDDVIEHFDFQELPGPDEVAGDSEVGL